MVRDYRKAAKEQKREQRPADKTIEGLSHKWLLSPSRKKSAKRLFKGFKRISALMDLTRYKGV